MASGLKTTLFGLFIFAIYFVSTPNSAASIRKAAQVRPQCVTRRWDVHIINGIDSSSIVINPKSGNDDLGIHILEPFHMYSFHFCEKFAGSTIFNSTFKWNDRLVRYPIFNDRIRYECHHVYGPEDCFWLVREDGFYMSWANNPFPQNWRKKYDWPSVLLP